MRLNKKLFQILFFIFAISFGFAKNSNSQTYKNGKIVAFHPSVGNSIDLSEKKQFLLFTEYNDSLFESAQLIKYNFDSFSVLFKTTKAESFEKSITIKELDEIYGFIEKAKPAATSLNDDYVDKKPTKEKQEKQKKREDHYDSVQIVAEITFQIIFVLLEILAQSY